MSLPPCLPRSQPLNPSFPLLKSDVSPSCSQRPHSRGRRGPRPSWSFSNTAGLLAPCPHSTAYLAAPTLTQSPLAHRHLSVSQSLAPLRGGRKRALATSLPCSMEQPACYQSPSSLYLLPGRPTIRDELVSLRQGRDFIWELADGEDGRLGPQNNHLVGAWMPGSFMDQRWVGGGEETK